MVTASAGIFMLFPTATIFLSRIIKVAFDKIVFASFTMVAFVNAYDFCKGSATPLTGKVTWAWVMDIKNVVIIRRQVGLDLIFLMY
jgi:hypothetical protein